MRRRQTYDWSHVSLTDIHSNSLEDSINSASAANFQRGSSDPLPAPSFVKPEDSLKRPASVLDEDDRKPGNVPVFNMMQLDWMTADGSALSNPKELETQLRALKRAKVAGVMADVWWGSCEPRPGEYEFGAAKALCKLLKDIGLQLQAVMSFHACGGNVGDTVKIPVPAWAYNVAKVKDLLYKSKQGVVSEDCLSLACDHKRIFPCRSSHELRTALQCYEHYISAFASAVSEFLGSVVVEIQVGMGACGELRYPSYLGSNGWQYPGVGLLMAYDAGMKKMLYSDMGMDEPPAGFPDNQNSLPDDVAIFKDLGTPVGMDYWKRAIVPFSKWYAGALVKHGREVLLAAATGLENAGADSCPPEKLCFSVKVSGLHWHVMHPSRATELLAGYDCAFGAAAYGNIAAMLSEVSTLAKRPVLFNFTCLEMNNFKYGEAHALSAPEDLIAEVRRACIDHGVPLSGENALEFPLDQGGWAFDQMKKQLHGWSQSRDKMHGLTILRLKQEWMTAASLGALREFAVSI